ncbi:MAG TPA: DUF4112 domain-containing protein [Thermoanaerobaculia bacterium]|nr:DUF4112 domain-containing protein [Thermoanaerobaculia bacterium]
MNDIKIPEVLEPDAAIPADLRALRKFAVLMDEAVAVPGTKKRVGLDAALGLIPGVGDAVGAFMSSWILFGALRHRVPLPKFLRMLFNVILDFALGSIPVVGDFFDFMFEENMANVEILIRHRDRSRPPRSWRRIGFGVAAVLLVLAAISVILLVSMILIVTSWRGRF